MSWQVQEDLVFDLGLHKGYDAEFYLKKGFRVVGLEAAPDLADLCRTRLAAWGNRLTVVNKALFDRPGETVSFFTVPNKDDWGSLNRNIAEKGTEQSVEITVETVDLTWLFDTFGVPRYIKCDIEGGDLIFREQLLCETRRPRFVSVEMNDGEEAEVLRACGYEVGQIVNQWMHHFRRPPNPPREGTFVPVQFTGEMSGLFGLELDPAKWVPLEKLGEVYHKWKSLRDFDQELAPGWVDLHAARRDDLGQ
ncbi:FkbM family methyltransferase [Tepidamorphus gemmatus]|uniref:FkbM family methyltransferase n=1 Tax=Tepidamorphus gemmatus TaxID=747076 RepID=A0A4R3MCV1_9HYPH|nr:FkbM family methyltransferase [Tepidamorphus gemmatus]TCT11420.1 FkbM family methyltransferase [Tepidamorphus gemmatus]